MRNISDSMNFQ